MCVQRGKVSEGLDFTDNLARAIVLVGVPYPPIYDKRIEMKKQYLDRVYNDHSIQTKKINGKDWYFNQAIKAVNQSIGRLIRHKDDYGAIFLCDVRFGGNDVQDKISSWAKSENKIQSWDQFT